LHRLILIQKRVVRSIAKAEYHAPSEPIFKELKILKVMEINSLQKGTFMFSYCNNLLPRSDDNLFVSGSQIIIIILELLEIRVRIDVVQL
jgi:hypothetical protein